MTPILIALGIILKAGDCWTSYRAITSGGGEEGNGTPAWLMARIGLIPALAVMFVGSVVALFAISILPAPYNDVVLGLVDAVLAWVVWHNSRAF